MSESESVPEQPEPEREFPASPKSGEPEPPALTGKALVKEVCRLIREARGHWDAHNNATARRVRSRAMHYYMQLTPEQKDEVPQVLRVWLRVPQREVYGSRRGGNKKKKPPNG